MFGMLTIFKWSDVRHQILNRSVESPTENFLGNGAAQASASSSSVGDLVGTTLLRAPNEAPIFAQPREPILQFTWLIGKKGANNTYERKFCRRRINGQPAMVYAHFSE